MGLFGHPAWVVQLTIDNCRNAIDKNAESFTNTKPETPTPLVGKSTSDATHTRVHYDIIPTPHISQDFFTRGHVCVSLELVQSYLFLERCTPGRTRTCNPQLRRLLLFPVELREHIV